jgi:hypothetical protein
MSRTMPLDSSLWHRDVGASSRPRVTFRPYSRHIWYRCVAWSQMRAALQLRRWCIVAARSPQPKVVRLLQRGLEMGCLSRVSCGIFLVLVVVWSPPGLITAVVTSEKTYQECTRKMKLVTCTKSVLYRSYPSTRTRPTMSPLSVSFKGFLLLKMRLKLNSVNVRITNQSWIEI